MEILENKDAWQAHYRQGWLAHAQKEGVADWQCYQHPRNQKAPGVPGIRLSHSRLMLVSSAGGYLRQKQQAFDAASLYGDYTIRTFPFSTPFTALAYAHDHFDHAMIDQDPQVALPLRYLEEIVSAGQIGQLVPSVVSFMGYQPDSARVVDELVPQVSAVARSEKVQAALLVPV